MRDENRDRSTPNLTSPEGRRARFPTTGGRKPDDRGGRRLRCEACGLRYGGGAIARAPSLAAARTCPRCGGALRAVDEALAERRQALAAVRRAFGRGGVLGA